MTIEEIIQALKQAYGSKYGVADDIYRGLAETLLATGLVTKENLATVVQGQDKVLRAIQSGNDKVATEIANLKTEKAELEKKDKTEPPKPDPKQDPKPDEQKGLTLEDVTTAIAKALEPVTQSINDINKAAKLKTRSEEIAAKAKEYGVPENFVKRFNIADDANLDDFFKEVKQDFANIGFEGARVPEQGQSDPAAGDGKQIADLIDAGTRAITDSKK